MLMIMSQDNNTTFMKSCSEGELINDSDKMNAKQTQMEGSRLKRTFTLPRNPFGTNRTSKHRPKQKEGDTKSIINVAIEQNGVENEKCGKKVFRRPSWKKFITKIAHHMNSVGVTAGKQQLRDGTINYGERVPPLGGYAWPTDCTPGATGLRNHGNTCFMNAVLQCLSHTDIIAEYFVLDQYKVDLSRRNKLNSKKFGTRGEVTEQLALILKALWACQYYPELSTGFKAVVERHGSQYRGSSQHDAQEFLLWLLDKVHEDLNTATKKKYKTIKNSVGRPDEVVAAETLANHVRCNSSFVQAVFQAQFRSSLACPRCHRQSNTFDPFHCISVQLPHLADHPLLVTVVYVNQQPRCVRLGVRVSASSAVRELRALLTNDTGIPTEDIILVEVTDTGFARTLSDCQSVWSGNEGENPNSSALYCVEAPRLTPSLPAEPPAPYILLLWLNLLVEEDTVTRFGSPYVMQVSRETDYADLQKLMLKEMSVMVSAGVLAARQEPGDIRLRILDPAADVADPHHYLQPELEHPLFTEAVEQALALCGENAGPPHLKILLEWERPTRDKLLVDWNENCEQHSSVGEVMENKGTTARLSLADCLAHYTRAETLAMEDAWRCPQCQQYLPVVKTLGLWSLPDILVIHLKRFRQQQMKGRNSTKLTTMVDFPLSGLDMSPHLAVKESQNGIPASPLLLGGAAWSPWKRPRKISNTFNDNSYDLYAVCYHHGNDLETGHYTAACKNPYDQRWYRFDDTRVTQIPTDLVTTELINDSAYILFYQRRHGSFVGSTSNSSSAASTSSVGSNCDHWAARMPKFTYQPKKDTIEKTTATTKTAEVAKSTDKIDTDAKKDETEINDIAETVNLRTSSSSLQDNHSNCKEQLSASPADEKNLRNSISLSDNLRISTADVAPSDASQTRLDLLEADKLINKNSLYTMGESRRNTLSEYKNINDEFNNENEAVHRNSISLTVNPYLHHKDIHVNPKMNFFKDMDDNKGDEGGDENQMARICLTGERGRRESDCEWIGTERGYSTLRVRNCLIDLTSQKDHHSDDEAPPARHDWVSPPSLRRPVVFSSANE